MQCVAFRLIIDSGMLKHSPSASFPLTSTLRQHRHLITSDATRLGEVRRAIRKLRNGNVAGPDDIPPELLKYADDSVALKLHELFLKMRKTRRVL